MSKNNLKKITLIGGTILGLGVIGYGTYKTLKNEDPEAKAAEHKTIIDELKVFLNAEFIFTQMLLLDDADALSNDEVNKIDDLSCIQYAKLIYENSRDFKTKEVRDVIRAWYLNNLAVVGNYLNTVPEKTMIGSFERLNKATSKLEKLSKKLGIQKNITNDSDVVENLLATYRLTEQEIIKNSPVAIHVANLHSFYINK